MPMERNAFIHLLLVVQSFYDHWCYSLKWNPSSTCTDRKWNPSSTFRLPLVPLLKQALPTPLLWLPQPLPLPPPLPLILLPPLMLSLHLLLALPILPLQPHYEHDAMMDIVILQVKTETFTLSLPIRLPWLFFWDSILILMWSPSSTYAGSSGTLRPRSVWLLWNPSSTWIDCLMNLLSLAVYSCTLIESLQATSPQEKQRVNILFNGLVVFTVMSSLSL